MKQTALKRKPMKRSQPRRDWTEAEEKRGVCRSCERSFNPTLAHVMGREHDKKSGYKVLPARVVCLCGPVGVKGTCHTRYDDHKLDLWHLLTLEEQWQAIEDAGGYWLAVKRAAPLEYRKLTQSEPEGAEVVRER